MSRGARNTDGNAQAWTSKECVPDCEEAGPRKRAEGSNMMRWVVKPKKTKEKAEAEIQPQFRSGGQLLQDNRNKTEHL